MPQQYEKKTAKKLPFKTIHDDENYYEDTEARGLQRKLNRKFTGGAPLKEGSQLKEPESFNLRRARIADIVNAVNDLLDRPTSLPIQKRVRKELEYLTVRLDKRNDVPMERNSQKRASVFTVTLPDHEPYDVVGWEAVALIAGLKVQSLRNKISSGGGSYHKRVEYDGRVGILSIVKHSQMVTRMDPPKTLA